MAKSPKAARAAAAPAFTVDACVTSIAGVVASGEREIRDFTQARKGQMFSAFCDALKCAPEVTEAAWRETWAPKMKAALVATGAYTDGSVGFMVSTVKVAVIGITHGHKPDGVASLRDYADKSREDLAKRGILTAVARAPRTPNTHKPTTTPGAKASDGASVTEIQAFRLAFTKAGQNPTQDRLELLSKIIHQQPVAFWQALAKIAVIS